MGVKVFMFLLVYQKQTQWDSFQITWPEVVWAYGMAQRVDVRVYQHVFSVSALKLLDIYRSELSIGQCNEELFVVLQGDLGV